MIVGVIILAAALRPRGPSDTAGTGSRLVTADRRGPILAGIWLIGLGIVFLLQQALALDWSEAWPMFVILTGSRASSRPRSTATAARALGLDWPVVTIVVGLLFLAGTTGYLGRAPLRRPQRTGGRSSSSSWACGC